MQYEQVKALGSAMRLRRIEMGNIDMAEAVRRGKPGISVSNWSKIENGHAGSYEDTTLAAIDRALDWPLGTAKAYATGQTDEVTLQANAYTVAELVALLRSEHEMTRAVVEQLRAELAELRQAQTPPASGSSVRRIKPREAR